jgi:ABC-2 type transport system ATP-binding protein/lipopolysaccharide transport system ATP-binding protein
MPSLTLDAVDVNFTLYQGGSRSLKKSVLSATTGGLISRDAQHRTVVHALRGISLDIREGDRVGLVGGNGSGKTTLLRVLAGVYEPTLGTISIRGRVTPVFDISMGVDQEATGYDNIFIRAAYLGLSKAQLRERIDDIADFTELGEYLYLPIRTYSQGMLLRLAFGVSTALDSEILLLDEWFGVGDAKFVEKADQRAKRFVDKSSIMVLASHSDGIIRRLCNKALWLNQGTMMAYGDVEDVLAAYHGFGAT